MKTIGLLGGMSWESTAEYYRIINREVADRLGGLHSARILIASVDFAEIAQMQQDGDWGAAGDALAMEAHNLEVGGADLLLICANTMHKVADRVEGAVRIPVLHVADVTAEAVQERAVSTVGLLGTKFTMEQDFYRDRLESHDLKVLVPDEGEREALHRIIYDELCRGVIEEASRERCEGIVASLKDRGAEGIILGCTELELILDPDSMDPDSDVPLFPTARLHALAAVDAAMKGA